MENTTTFYKGVPLTHGRTEQLIDTIIENRTSMKATELAELIGFSSFRPLVSIFRYLNKQTETRVIKAPVVKKQKETVAVKEPKIVVKTAKNTFKNYYGTGKDKARDLIAHSIMLTKRRGSNILTLPADEWVMEKNILKQKLGYKFTAVERDKETYQRMVKNLVSDEELFNSVIGTANKSIGEVIVNDNEDTYSSAILDYCGFVDSFYDEINDVMKRNLIKKGGYIAITLAENDRILNNSYHMNNHSNTFIKNCYVGEVVTGAKITNDLINFLVHSNNGYKIVNKFPYRDKQAKMLLFIIQRIEE